MNNSESQYKPTSAQLALRTLIRDKTNILAYGGSRSGKTFEMCRAVAVLAFRYGGRYAIFRRFANAVRSSVFVDTFPKMMRMCFGDYQYEQNRTCGEIYFPHNGAEIDFVGLDDDRRVEKILGREFAAIYFNECSEISYRSIEIATTRLAQRRYDSLGRLLRNRLFFDCNPPGKSHWSYKMFIEGVHPVSRVRLVNFEKQYGAIQINPYANAENLPDGYIDQTLGNASERSKKRFLYGEFSEENENALWKATTMIDPFRATYAPKELERIVVGVDPAVTSNEASDHTGIIVCGSCALQGVEHFYVLEDSSLIASPEVWAERVCRCYENHLAELVVAETNQGGDLVESVLRNVAPNLPIKKVRATRGKIVRAEPISTLYAQGRVHHVGYFEELENEMTSYTGDRTAGDSPDRMDALVWALTELSSGGNARTEQGELYFG